MKLMLIKQPNVCILYLNLLKFINQIISKGISSLQNEDGSFNGDKWGEVDTRFSYCAISALSLLKRLDLINVNKAVEFISRCQNFDGAFGTVPNAESHAGQSMFLLFIDLKSLSYTINSSILLRWCTCYFKFS